MPVPADLPKEALTAYFRDQHDVLLAFLFGSQARGDAGPHSDVDLAVWLAPEAARDPAARTGMLTELMRVCGRPDIDLVVLNQASPLLQHRVLRDGHVLFARGTRVLAEFTIRAMQEYVDTELLRALRYRWLRQQLAKIGLEAKGGPVG